MGQIITLYRMRVRKTSGSKSDRQGHWRRHSIVHRGFPGVSWLGLTYFMTSVCLLLYRLNTSGRLCSKACWYTSGPRCLSVVIKIGLIIANGQRVLTKGDIAILSPLAAVNEFVRPWPSFNTWFLGPTRISPQIASRSDQPFLQAFERDQQTDRQTDRQTDKATLLLRLYQ